MTTDPAPAPLQTIGWVDEPASEGIVGPDVHVTGWALAASRIRAVEIRLDGVTFNARFGLPRHDVADVRPGYPDNPNSGFEFTGRLDARPAPPNVDRRRLAIVAIAHDGSQTLLGERTLVEPRAHRRWRFAARDDMQPFLLLPAVSGIAAGGAFGMDTRYSAYTSVTTRVGMRVPILYLRTTQGAAGGYCFDADFDVERRAGARPIADDSLSHVLAHSATTHLPVLITLNGGIWSDAAGTVTEWDLTDRLEEDRANCQWNERDEVMADDYLKDLPGSHAAPELARALTLNIHASAVRRMKKRNLQQAAQSIVAFMREHPDLLVGVNLDPDVYINPFFSEAQWYDYNPGTLRQFREWLAGAGPYASASDSGGIPDLSSFRREPPLTLHDVSGIAQRTFTTWDDVDPPRVFSRSPQHPYWNDPWVRQWETFRRHLVSVHYTELAQWLVEAGVPSDRIWSSQGLMAPAEGCMPLALRVTSAVKDYDSGGVSIEGSKPRDGHLGAIVYGDAATNAIAMENGSTLFATLAAIDDGFAIVEFNTADLRFPERQPTYAAAYRAWRDLWNAGARLVSPMAWNGSNCENASDPGYVSFTAWRNTPLEEAARDFLLARSGLPRGSKLWTFGTQAHPDDDGWTAEAGSLATSPGALQLDANWHGVVTLRSPAGVELEAARIDSVVLGLVPDAGIARIEIAARGAKAARWQRLVRCEGRAIEWVEAGARLHGTRGVDGPIDRLRIAITVAKRARITLARVAILMR
jgi:hypothetical protein